MIHDIFTNITIVVSFLLVIGQFFKNNTFDFKQKFNIQILLGMTFGSLGIILMSFTIKITDTVIIDLRNISIICAGIMGGPVAAILSSVIVAVFRITFFGVNDASMIGLIVSLIVGTGTAYIGVMKLSRRNKFILMFLFSMIMSNVALVYLLGDTSKLLEVLSYYWFIYIFGIILAYFTCEYIISANSNYKTMMYYRMTTDNLTDMISIHELGGRIKFVSPSIKTLFGYSQDEYLGSSAYEYIHPEDLFTVKKAFENPIQENDTSTQVLRKKCKDGSYVWVEVSVKILKNDDGTTKEMICVTRDITKRKQIEQELTVSNSKFKAIFDNAGMGIIVRDVKGKLIEANKAYLDMLGFSKEEAFQVKDIIHPDDYSDAIEQFQNLVSGKDNSIRSETRYIDKNKQVIHADVTTTLIPSTKYTPTLIIRILDNITERKKIEEKLVESEERFRVSFDNAAIGMCLAHTDGRFIKPNQAFCELLGYSEEEIINMDFQQITHPDDMEKDLSLMKKLLAGEISQFLFEKRYYHKSGIVIWALLCVSVVLDTKKKPKYLIGQIQDITSRKLAEEELHSAKLKAEKLASTDYLTGILNRRAFEDRFNEEFVRVGRENTSISLILTDIDHFKKVNDTFGHQAGDVALQEFSKCLSDTCRPYDFIGRHGGEEFIICLPGTNCEQAAKIAERMRTAVEKMEIHLANRIDPIRITASFGISSPIQGSEESIYTLIKQADRAMYKAKTSGRNRVCLSCEQY